MAIGQCLLFFISANIFEPLSMESLLLLLKRSQLRWYCHMTTMRRGTEGRTAEKLLCTYARWSKPRT